MQRSSSSTYDPAEHLARDIASYERLPPEEREQALDLLVIKHGALLKTVTRNQAIEASSNVIRLSDGRTKLPVDPA